MSKLRPEVGNGRGSPTLPRDTMYFLIKQAINKRRRLIYGKLHSHGEHCAIGCFWEDHPQFAIHQDLIDEVAAVNDSVPWGMSEYKRWLTVNRWLKLKLGMTQRK